LGSTFFAGAGILMIPHMLATAQQPVLGKASMGEQVLT
jgi:hypothetical protein